MAEYKNKSKDRGYDIPNPGTAGIAQRIDSKYRISEDKETEKIKGLFALMLNDVMPCSQNQY